MNLKLENYQKQLKRWPSEGRHVMAQFDEEKVVVYQAYRPEIGLFAAQNGYFGGAFSYTRMSWIKPNFLWMMYRSGWASKAGQEVILAIHLKRSFFDEVLENAYPSTNIHGIAQDEWAKNISKTNIRLQWDPDHDPKGHKQDRRAIQLGLRNEYLAPFKGDGILDIEDISSFVRSEYKKVQSGDLSELMLPFEECYPVSDQAKRNLAMP